MRDINILINEDHTLTFPNDYAGLQEENLQGNITFSFNEFVQGQARAEIIINNESGYIELEQVNETYVLPIKASLLTSDFIIMQLVIDEPAIYNLTTDTTIKDNQTYYEKVGDEYIVVTNPVVEDLDTYYVASIPVWKSETFTLKVGFSINATTTIPEDYPSWVEIIDELVIETEKAIAKASNVNISSEQLTDGVKVITTNQDGEQTITIVPQGPKGDKGDAGAIKMLIVAELPSTGADDTIYLVPLETPDTTGNNYAEYVYINGAWELLGKIGVQVDLTDYVKNTDLQNTIDTSLIPVTKISGTFQNPIDLRTLNNGNYLLSGSIIIESNSYLTTGGGYYASYNFPQFLASVNIDTSGEIPVKTIVSERGNFIYTNENNAWVLQEDVAYMGIDEVYEYVDGLVGDINTALDSINGEVI